MNYKELTESIGQQTPADSDDPSIILLRGEGMSADYSDAFVGIVDGPHSPRRALYDYGKCVEIARQSIYHAGDGSANYQEGLEWFEHNTLRAISYQNPESSPLFLNKIDSYNEV